MSPEGAQQAEQKKGPHRSRKLRDVPGLTTAMVAFVLVVLLGSGGVAIAMWNQSATATIAITAGAPIPGTILTVPEFAIRPAATEFLGNPCKPGSPSQSNARFNFTWSGGRPNTTDYVVTLVGVSGNNYNQTQTVQASQATFAVKQSLFGSGSFILRVQPMNGGIAGDPIYKTVLLSYHLLSTDCSVPTKQEPLPATFNVSTAAPAPGPTDSVIKLGWTAPASGATSYVVSIKANQSSYGAEFTTTTRTATFTFPPRSQNGVVIAAAPFYGDYTLRIQPMNGATAGDPVYKDVTYSGNNLVMVE